MLSLKIEGGGHIDLLPSSIVAFEEIPENSLENRPKARSTIYFNVGDGLSSHTLENNYEVIKGAVFSVKKTLIEITVISSGRDRNMCISRDSIKLRQEILPEEVEVLEGPKPATAIKADIDGQIVTFYIKETREELALL